jgi:CRISPR-associated endonuclease/helicase Cas3
VDLARAHLRERIAGLFPEDHDARGVLLDLVLHLIESHHGWCRPFPPPVWDPARRVVRCQLEGRSYEAPLRPERYRLDSGAAERFQRLTRYFGWWGLAWLEALLRLADHLQSQREARGEQSAARGAAAMAQGGRS